MNIEACINTEQSIQRMIWLNFPFILVPNP